GSFQAPWSSLGECGEQYCLVWESRFLRDLGSAMASLLDGLVGMVAQEALKYTILSGIVTALTWPAGLLAAASVIDHPWCVCLSRSAEVGKHLAQVLQSRRQGKRPVSLIGFSLGARVIYYCLQELANDKGSEGMVEDVVLLGAPVDGSEKAWERISRVVAGKIVNGYCRGDWLLGFLYRSSAAQMSVAGLQPVELNDQRVINVDLSSVVKGHLDYMKQMDTILVAVGMPTREAPGASASFGPLNSVTVREADHPDPPGLADPQAPGSHPSATREREGEETSDGWDIPDISDLLASLGDDVSVVAGDRRPGDAGTPPPTGPRAPDSPAEDGENLSWGWDDAPWAAQSKHVKRGDGAGKPNT
ncbi:transmembrane and coiled-coil domain-containing protein 4, partial [Gadus chalcogrammus]|uniref:transmembrane and coiled-coil domain-containing protein 4 n=1 Tax=Gadus chalcogrammus TaxID=1042646 RepID=UPI0024C34DBE